jgi:diaminohydroxyphosphoribosylaminopyrimidine deaminase / 5-amino-6-(5-phosphoribosylamino)uracil reductase
MARAVELARPERPHPNPRVGAVVVDADGEVIGEGAHAGPGQPHAEVVALNQAGHRARGGTLYVTLEPCNHHGRTPPCVDALLSAGIMRVVAATVDPDTRTAGAGLDRLRRAGVEVAEGLMSEEATRLDEGYFHHRRTGLPLVTWKYAMTLDGSVAAADSTSRWVTSEEARLDAHRLRSDSDGVVVGAGTLRADDPGLTVRSEGFQGPQPAAVVIAGSTELPTAAAIWQREPIVVSTSRLDLPSGSLVVVSGHDGRPDPVAACRALGDLGLLDLLLEGGPTLAGEWWRAGVIRRGVAYVAGRVGGGTGRGPLGGLFATIDEAEVVSITTMRSLGADVRIDFER